MIPQVEDMLTFGIKDVNEEPYDLELSSTNAIITYKLNEPKVRENIPSKKYLTFVICACLISFL